MHRTIALALAILGIAGAIWFLRPGQPAPWTHILGRSGHGQPTARLGPTDARQPEIGQPAPQFTLLDLDGRPTKLSELRGKTVVLNFWATWCIPCRQEFPELVALYDKNVARGLVVLGVDLQEEATPVRDFAAEFNASFPMVLDLDGSVARQYRLIGPPTTFFIDESGVLRAIQVGALTQSSIHEKLRQAGFALADSP